LAIGSRIESWTDANVGIAIILTSSSIQAWIIKASVENRASVSRVARWTRAKV